jgi:hypothetical protein
VPIISDRYGYKCTKKDPPINLFFKKKEEKMRKKKKKKRKTLGVKKNSLGVV